MNSTVDMEKHPLIEAQDTPEPEPSLLELQQNIRHAQRAYMQAWSRSTSGKWHKRLIFTITGLLFLFMLFCLGVLTWGAYEDDYDWPQPIRMHRVPLEAHIMSKCPDAKDCLHDMILPAMQNVSDKVDFRLSYIGSSPNGDGGDGVECKHGEEECLGNMVELCAAHLYPDPKIYLGFVMCMTRDYQDIPSRDLIEDCALEHSISMAKLNKCLSKDDGAYVADKLRASFNRTAEAGVTKSCTVRLNDEVRCVRDGGEWTDCDGGHETEDLVADIMELSKLAIY